MSNLRIQALGPFAMFRADGAEVPIQRSKEKALVALLAFAPQHRRTRSWLIDKLWGSRFPQQGRTSLRQALKNLRKSFGPEHAKYLFADRFSVGLIGPLDVVTHPAPGRAPGVEVELLEDIDIAEAEFEDWIRDLRAAHARPTPPLPEQPAQAPSPPPLPSVPATKMLRIGLRLDLDGTSPEGRGLGQHFLDTVTEALNAWDGAALYVLDRSPSQTLLRDLDARVELTSNTAGQEWFGRAQVTCGSDAHFSWSGRLRLPLRFRALWDSPKLSRFAGQIATAVSTSLMRDTGQQAPFLMFQRAVSQIYSGKADQIEMSDMLLERVVGATGSAAATAWRAYARLTRLLEFRTLSEAHKDEARDLIHSALSDAPRHAQVNALAAMVQFKLLGDLDHGHFLAKTAFEADDRNPHALDAFSQSMFFHGEYTRGHQASLWAQEAAGPLQHSFNWDMRVCLTALSLGKFEEARKSALTSHFKAPAYRPALRYLYALNLLLGAQDDAARFLARLKKAEPGFAPRNLLLPDYPVDTFRSLGLHDGLSLPG